MGGGGGRGAGDEDTRRCMAKCTMQSRLQWSWMILRKLFCNLATGQLRAWKFPSKGSPHRCRHGLDPHRICVFCLHVVTKHRGAWCQVHHPRRFLVISAPLRAALLADVFSSKPGNVWSCARHVSSDVPSQETAFHLETVIFVRTLKVQLI